MKRLLSFTILSLLFVSVSFADVSTDKAMAKISRDTKTYLSADVRAATEDEAYEEAKQKLSALIADYLKTECPGRTFQDDVISTVSNMYERMTSKIAENRYRVMLYVRRADLNTMDKREDAVVKSKDNNGDYSLGTDEERQSEKTIRTDTTVEVLDKSLSPVSQVSQVSPVSPVLSALSNLHSRNEIVDALQSYTKSKQISRAAAFPIANATDFYVVVIEGESTVAILHFYKGDYFDITTSEIVDVNNYSNCIGYWFILPKQ